MTEHVFPCDDLKCPCCEQLHTTDTLRKVRGRYVDRSNTSAASPAGRGSFEGPTTVPTTFPPVPGDNGQAAHDRPPFRLNGQVTREHWEPMPTALPSDKAMLLPTDPAERKRIPIGTGVLDYFPLALAEVARVSKAGNDQHHPGQPLHWDKTKSLDHADCIPRHFIDRHARDTDGMRHSAKLAWRALAMLQTELEAEARS